MSTRNMAVVLIMIVVLLVVVSPAEAQSVNPVPADDSTSNSMPVAIQSAEASEINGCRDVPNNWNLRIIVVDLTLPIDNNWIPATGYLSIDNGEPQEWCTQRVDQEYKAAFRHVPSSSLIDINAEASDPYPRRICRGTSFQMPADADVRQYELRLYCMAIRTYIAYIVNLRR